MRILKMNLLFILQPFFKVTNDLVDDVFEYLGATKLFVEAAPGRPGPQLQDAFERVLERPDFSWMDVGAGESVGSQTGRHIYFV